MKYMHTRTRERFTLNLRVSRWKDYLTIGSGAIAIALIFFTHGLARYLWGAAGIVAFLSGIISLVYVGVLHMGPEGVAGWHMWRWHWISWDELVSAETVRSQEHRGFDQLVLHDKSDKVHAIPGLETPRRVASREGSVQWAADIINTVIAGRQTPRSPSSTE